MIEYLNTPLFGVAISIAAFALGQFINKKFKISILNPLLISIVAIIGFLIYFNIDYEIYNKGGSVVSFFLGPATVVLAVPLYKQIKLLKQHALPIIIGIFLGSIAGIASIIILSKLFNLDELLMISLIPKSTTAAIAMDISKEIGGIPALTMGFVVITGSGGYIIGPFIFKLFKIENEIAKGISFGTASHAMGTAKAMEIGEVEGAMSSLAISVAGLITVFLAPFVISLLNMH